MLKAFKVKAEEGRDSPIKVYKESKYVVSGLLYRAV
jgi:hypothetical protein